MTRNQEKKQSTETDPEMTDDMIELEDKDVKTPIIDILYMLKDVKDNMNIMKRKMI